MSNIHINITLHPYEVWTGGLGSGAVFSARFSNEKCAIRTAVQRQGHVIGPWMALTYEECRREFNHFDRPFVCETDRINPLAAITGR